MITRIEIDGFKTFQDFAVDLAPFQVIIGPNGCGKSNLFEAMKLLFLLADNDIRSAFESLRGEPYELFTLLPTGKPCQRMRFTVEMLVEKTVKDNWGAEVQLPNPRLRYELEIHSSSGIALPRLYIADERLESIPPNEDDWLARFASLIKVNRLHDLPSKASREVFMDARDREPPNNTLTLHEDPLGITKRILRVSLAFSKQTTLGRIDNCDFPHILAARKEMQSWRYLHPDPAKLRLPSSVLDDPYLTADGGNMPTTLARMETEDPALLNDVGRDLGNLVSDVCGIEIDKDVARNSYSILAKTRDGRRIPARLLSDGTLRMLALATLRNDPERRGVLCLEEPENSVHPAPLERLVRLLRNMTTDLSDTEQTDEPLRQLLVSTHSPELVGHLDILHGELLYAEMVTRIVPRVSSMRVTQMIPVRPDAADGSERSYSIARVIEYLKFGDTGEFRAHLRKELTR